MSQFSRVVVIYNPNSTGDGEQMARDLVQSLSLAVPIDLIETEHAGHADEIAYEVARAETRPLIISSSGDGGYNEVVNGALRAQLEGARPVCAVLAAGNANDHSHAITQEESLVDLIVNESVHEIDVLAMTVRSASGQQVRYAHSYIGLGLTPTVAVELNKNRLTWFKETYLVFRTLRALQPVEIEVDNRVLRIDSLVISNINRMAKVLSMARNARPDDGRFKITVIPNRSRFRLLHTLITAMAKGLAGKSAKQFDFTATKQMAVQADGEVIELDAQDSVSIAVMPSALSTLR